MDIAYILGCKINNINQKEALHEIEKALRQNRNHFLITPNPEICLKSYYSKPYRRTLNQADISIPDGFGLRISGWILGEKITKRTTGADLTKAVLNLAEQKNYSILLLGGPDQITGEKALKNVKAALPKLRINFLFGGACDDLGNFKDANVVNKINQIHPDIIFVNLGAPKQEYFMQKNVLRINSKLMLGVGGTIDYLSGRIKRAPQIFRMLGCEWLWRLIQEPKRIIRIYNAVIKFPLCCIKWKFYNTFIYRKNVAAMIINNKKQIWLGLSIRGHWQFPQGGAKNGEPLNKAIIREVSDEIGSNKFKILNQLVDCYKYEWPKNSISRRMFMFKGQKQSLFLMLFTGNNSDFKLSNHDFKTFKWVNKTDIINETDKLKRPLIKIGLEQFKF